MAPGGWWQSHLTLLAAGLLHELGEKSHPGICHTAFPTTRTNFRHSGGGPLETTSPTIQHYSLSSKDGFKWHGENNDVSRLSPTPEDGQQASM